MLHALERKCRFGQAVEVIDDHLAEPSMSLDWLARRVGISPRQLQRDFGRNGESFVRLVRDKRLDRAASRLAAASGPTDGAARVTDAALDSGFRDISNFNRAFKRRFGCSPSAYARACGGPRAAMARAP